MKRFNTLFEWFGRLQIIRKIILIFLPLIIIPLFISGFLSSYNFRHSTIQNMEQNVLDESKLIISQINSIITNAENSANIIATDMNRIINNSPKERNSLQELQFRRQIQSKLSIDLILFTDVDSAIFIDTDHHIYTSYSNINVADQEVFKSGMIQQIISKGSFGMDRWFPMMKRDYLVSNPEVPILTLGKVVIDVDSGNRLGTLFINVPETSFSSFLGGGETQDLSKSYFIVDANQRIIASSDTKVLLQPFETIYEQPIVSSSTPFSTMIDSSAGQQLLTVIGYDIMNWNLVNINGMTTLTSAIQHNIWMTIAIGLVCLFLSLLGAGFLSRIIVNPLLQLTKTMRKVKEGDLNVSATITTQDETGLLASVFNMMIERIKQLIITVENDQLHKREYELALIHAQIKPHFLYNTLDTIYVLADMDRAEEARDTTKALADFYRVILSKGSEIITLAEEAKIVNGYLMIMQIRNPDILRYDIHIPDELQRVDVPKLSLQPLVENAIYHGLKMSDHRGFIRISAHAQGNNVIIQVEDNGVGMSPSLLSQLMNFRHKIEKPTSIGIYSVHERVKLYYGDMYGVTVQSTEGQGTLVEITIPNTQPKGELHV
ncbi:sensor histidine kinase [Paenibacillus sp. FA6]|uniref:sensor histidine kinase n=1 Tax=Paenibacillus sp. FA6 TaxID=3413029 RepID=UPI003F654A74